jgi:hypothetical protein
MATEISNATQSDAATNRDDRARTTMAGVLAGGWETAALQTRDQSRGYRQRDIQSSVSPPARETVQQFPTKKPAFPV